MKKIFLIILSAFFLLSFACKMIYFTEPQPSNGLQLDMFPDELQGAWVDSFTENLDTVIVDNKGITIVETKHKIMHVDELDSSSYYYMSDGYIQDLNSNSKAWFPFEQRGDSIEFQITDREGYYLSDSLILKRIDKNYCINISEEGKWMPVAIVIQENGDISYQMIDYEQDLEVLNTIIKDEPDSIGGSSFQYDKSLTKKKFKKCLKAGLFSSEIFILEQNKRIK